MPVIYNLAYCRQERIGIYDNSIQNKFVKKFIFYNTNLIRLVIFISRNILEKTCKLGYNEIYKDFHLKNFFLNHRKPL